jgi:hypothetical protein
VAGRYAKNGLLRKCLKPRAGGIKTLPDWLETSPEIYVIALVGSIWV